MYNIDKLTTNHRISISRHINNYADYASINTFPTSLLTPFENFSPFYQRFEDES